MEMGGCHPRLVVEQERNGPPVSRGGAKVYGHLCPVLPLLSFSPFASLELGIKHVGGATKSMEMPHNGITLDLGELLNGNLPGLLDRSVVMGFVDGRHGIRLEVSLDVIRPSLICVNEAGTSGFREIADALLSHSVMVVGVGPTESDGLSSLPDLIYPSLLGKSSVVRMAVFNNNPSISCIVPEGFLFLKGLLSDQIFLKINKSELGEVISVDRGIIVALLRNESAHIGIMPGVVDWSWSTETQSPGALTSGICCF